MALPPFPVPKPDYTPKPPADKPKDGGYPFADETLASGLCDATIPGKAPYDIKAWMVYGTNLIQALPNQKQTIDAIQKLDFICAIDVLPAEICGWSDVVLPESTYLERHDDLWVANYKEPFIAMRQPAVEPMYDSKPGWWIAKELGRKLGLEKYFPWKDAEEVIATRVQAGGYDLAKLKATGVILGKPQPNCEEEGLPPVISTESKKIELYSKALKAAGFDPMPTYYPPEEVPPGMFKLLTGRAPVHTFGRTTNNRLLKEAFPENELWLNTEAAKTLAGFSRPPRTGDRVVVVNQDGVRSLPIKVKVTERIRGDCVYMVHGWGHTSKGLRYARGKGACDAGLTTRYKIDPIMGGTGMLVNFVRLEPATAKVEA
jgi:thiosulfate reductase/polysulfide reductase chain A